jgi:hypothetical protein
MVALIVGIVLILFAVYAVLPLDGWGLWWWDEVLLVLKGGIPLIAVFVGLIAVLIGIADIRDRIEAKKEEESEAKESGDSGKSESAEPGSSDPAKEGD